MVDLRLNTLYTHFLEGKISKRTAIDLLISILEDGEDEKKRFHCANIMRKIGLKNQEDFEFLEVLLIFDSNWRIRALAGEIIIHNFFDTGKESIMWALEHDNSPECLSSILRALKTLKINKYSEGTKSEFFKLLINLFTSRVKTVWFTYMDDEVANKIMDIILNSYLKNDIEGVKWALFLIQYIFNNEIYSKYFLKLKFESIKTLISSRIKSKELFKVFKTIIERFNARNETYIDMKIMVIEKVIKDYLEEGKTIIEQSIKRDHSPRVLSSILYTLNSIEGSDSLNLKKKLFSRLIKRYRVDQEEAIALMKLDIIEGNTKIHKGFRREYVSYSSERKHVQYLNLEYCDLGESPDLFGKFPYLKRLLLKNNQLKGFIKPLKNLSLLEELAITNNEIKEFRYVDQLLNLKILNLANNKISNIKSIRNLINLKELNLSRNLINKIKDIAPLTNLEKLILTTNYIAKIKGLKNLTTLKTLSLRSNKLKKISGLKNLINLRKLDLSNNNISKIKGLESLENLEELNLKGNPIPKNIINELGGLSELGKANTPQLFVEYCKNHTKDFLRTILKIFR